jgi:hypothetical protein
MPSKPSGNRAPHQPTTIGIFDLDAVVVLSPVVSTE